MKTRLIIFVFILFIFNKQTKAQYDTIFLNIPELIINNKSFIYDLDTMLKKSYLCEIKDRRIFTIYVKQTSEESYLFTVLQAPLYYKKLAYANGFFKINGINFFVVGNELLSEYPKGLFTITNNLQQFYYLKFKEWVTFNDGDCWIDLEYRDEKLFFLRKYR